MSTVGDRLDELMRAHPIYGKRGAQSALNRKTGIPQSTISRILKNKTTPETENILILAAEFDVSVEWLATGGGERTRSVTAIDGSNAEMGVSEMQEVSSEDLVSIALKSLRTLMESTSPLFHNPIQEEISGFLAGKRSIEQASSTLIALHQASRSMPTTKAGLLETNEIPQQSVETKKK